MNTCIHDEDVENNYNQDVVPDVLNPYIDSDFVAPTRTIVPLHTQNFAPQAPKFRSRPVVTKKKIFLTVNTFCNPSHL